jgi:hypothetical protein
VIREILVIKGLLELLDHPQAHQADQDLAGHRGLVAAEVQLLWRPMNLVVHLTNRHHRHQRCEQWSIPKLKPMPKICSYRQRFRASERKCRDRLSNSR